MKKALLILIASIFLVYACKQRSEVIEDDFSETAISQSNPEINEVLYSMYLPTDLAEIFRRSGTNYDPELPCPIEDVNLYTINEQAAIMMGVYGVDITYMKLMGSSAVAAQYYQAVEDLSRKIDLPPEIFDRTANQLEEFFDNEDSLTIVIENIYKEADEYFRENEMNNLAALSLVGGWIEAMYIGSRIFVQDTGNYAIAERLLQQKFSLNSLYTILSNYQESLLAKEYLLMLKKLKRDFADIEIRYEKEGFSVDTTQKKLQSYSAQINYDAESMDRLLKNISLVRNEIIRIRFDGLSEK